MKEARRYNNWKINVVNVGKQFNLNGYPDIFNQKDTCPNMYRNVYICKACEKQS